MIKPALTILGPSTRIPVDAQPARSFPIVVMEGDTPHLVIAENAHRIPPLPPRSSYLIPAGSDRAVEKRLNDDHRSVNGETWVLHVERFRAGRQRIELYWMNDGFGGGGYDATASSITPLYRKVAGPAFAITFGGLAALMSAALWLIVGLLIRRLRQIQGSSAVGP